jgi:LysR family transcriptional regulator for metE and metH
MAYPWLTEVVLSLRRSAPDLRIEMPIEHSQRAPDALAAGELDAAMLTSAAPRGALAEELFEDELVFLVSAAHPLAKKAALAPRDVAESTLLVPNARSEDGWFLRQVFGARPPRVRAERLPVTEAIVELARAGLGVAVLSEWVAAPYLRAPESGLKMLRLAKGPLVRRWRFAYRPELAPAAPLLVDAILGARPIARLEPPAASAAPRRRAETRQKQGRSSARER